MLRGEIEVEQGVHGPMGQREKTVSELLIVEGAVKDGVSLEGGFVKIMVTDEQRTVLPPTSQRQPPPMGCRGSSC